MSNCHIQTDGVAILEKLEDIRDSIDIVISYRPANEYEILDGLSSELTDILIELKQKGGKEV